MRNAPKLRDKIAGGKPCFCATITFTDPTVSESLCDLVDFLWIDMEHNPFSLETVLGHIMATKGSDTAALVRVPSHDPALIKTVLDLGADGIIAPNVHNAREARQVVAACRYPPLGMRGFGPRRPSNYERCNNVDYCRRANDTVITFAQLESAEAVDDIDQILAVPGLTGICFGANDMSGTMGCMGEGGNPKVVRAIETCISKARAAGVIAGMSTSLSPDKAVEWIEKGAQWLQLPNDYSFMCESLTRLRAGIQERLSGRLSEITR
jgi:2-keto-3-deoxy-L-rhamnonate aldolase RhmA